MMWQRRRRTVGVAIAILRDAARSGNEEKAQTLALRLALRVLMDDVNRGDLVRFWQIAGERTNPSRRINLRRSLEAIEAQIVQRLLGE